jgi:hypothetical protein
VTVQVVDGACVSVQPPQTRIRYTGLVVLSGLRLISLGQETHAYFRGPHGRLNGSSSHRLIARVRHDRRAQTAGPARVTIAVLILRAPNRHAFCFPAPTPSPLRAYAVPAGAGAPSNLNHRVQPLIIQYLTVPFEMNIFH